MTMTSNAVRTLSTWIAGLLVGSLFVTAATSIAHTL